MLLLRKIGSGFLLVVAVVTFLLSATSVFGAWIAKVTVDQTSLAVLDLLEGYMGLASQTLTSIDGGLGEAQRTLATVRSGAQELREGDTRAARLLQLTVSDDLLPRLDRLTTGASQLEARLSSLNEQIERLNRMPLVDLPTVPPELASVAEAVGTVVAQAQELRAAAASLDFARVATLSGQLETRLSDTRATVSAANQRVTNLQASLSDLRTALTFWSSIGAGFLSVLMFVFALGQASLAAHAWGWLRAETWGGRRPGHAAPS